MTAADIEHGPKVTASTWRSFVKSLVATAFGASAFVYLLVLIVDPYDSVSFSPAWERYPVTSHSRPYNATLASSGHFDSAVIGNSTSMLLHPAELEAQFGGRFVNVAMPAASTYEQVRMLELLDYTQTYTGTLIIGLDPFSCAPDGSPPLLEPMVGQVFPEWLYDDSRWNDLPPLNRKTLQHARSQLLAMLGVRIRHPRRPDGYRDFTQTYRTDRDLESVRKRIYGGKPWTLHRTREDTPPSFPDIDVLGGALSRFPSGTLKIAYFIPFHAYHQPTAGDRQHVLWTTCKTKAAGVLGNIPNTAVLDFMIPSPITTEDRNYVDAQHYTTAVATELAFLLHEGAFRPDVEMGAYRVLSRSDPR